MKKLMFKNSNGDLIFTISVNFKEKTVSKAEVEKDRGEISKIYYPDIEAPSYTSLERLIAHYCDKDGYDLETLISHIEENGFYTPYRPNLRIYVETD